jgi:multidrug efflux pump subunit AcrA (membrane-fusion protein)
MLAHTPESSRQKAALASSDDVSIVPPGLGFWGRVWFWVKFWLFVKTARLRFVAVLAAIGAVIAYWDTLIAYYEKWTRPPTAAAFQEPMSEYWCPMHPTIVRDRPDKCPICGMPLSKRKKGDVTDDPLPPGTISRLQLTPYRVALAGVQTAEIDYRPLAKQVAAVGFVEFDERGLARITARTTGRSRIDKLYANVTGQVVRKGDPLADLYSPDLVVTVQNLLDARRSGNNDLEKMALYRLELWGIEPDQLKQIVETGRPVTHVTIRSPISGHVIKKYQVEGEYVEEGTRLYDVADLHTVWVEAEIFEEDIPFVRVGLTARAVAKALPDRIFTGTVAFVQPHLDAATRTLRVRLDVPNPNHELRPGMYATVTIDSPVSSAIANATGAPASNVLAVPERAVIDTGSRKIVYREASPGVFEGVVVELGPRIGDFYAVTSGIKAGERVATTGSFLIDAETRLTAGAGSLASSPLPGGEGNRKAASVRSSMGSDEEAEIQAALAKLSPADKKAALAQKTCPYLGTRLGSMGVPVKVQLKGESVFLCCKGCENDARADADSILTKLRPASPNAEQSQAREPARDSQSKPLSAVQKQRIEAALSKLTPEDRKLAETQVTCPITKAPLGSMGPPLKITLEGETAFLCCESCQKESFAQPKKTLDAVRAAKAKSKAGRP